MSLLHLLENALALPWRKFFRLGKGYGGTKVILNGEWAGVAGRKVLVGRSWAEQITPFMKRRGITELDLCYLKSDDCAFLSGLTFLTGLRFCTRPNDISAINTLTNLKYLELGYGPKPNIHVDPRKLLDLELFHSDWHSCLEPIFDCTNLTSFAIEKFPGKQGSRAFAKLINLKQLCLSSSGLEEIENFKVMSELESLDLLNMAHLRSLHGIEGLTNLKKLRIESCKNIGDIEPVRGLRNLEFLSVSDCGEIASLEPVRNLKKLHTLQFYESTNVRDGKLAVLETLPKLRVIQFKNRKHYDRTESKGLGPEVSPRIKQPPHD